MTDLTNPKRCAFCTNRTVYAYHAARPAGEDELIVFACKDSGHQARAKFYIQRIGREFDRREVVVGTQTR